MNTRYVLSALWPLCAALCLALPLASAPTAAAEASSENVLSPLEFLNQHDGHAKEIIPAAGDTLSGAKRQEVKEHINGAFDFAELSRRALGSHWDELEPAERQRFVDTFSAIIAEKNFDSFLRYYRDGSIQYQGEEQDGDAAEVKAEVPIRDRDETVNIVYRLHRVEGEWRIYDLVIDEASTVDGYQRQYDRYLKKKTYQQLMENLDKQLARLQK